MFPVPPHLETNVQIGRVGARLDWTRLPQIFRICFSSRKRKKLGRQQSAKRAVSWPFLHLTVGDSKDKPRPHLMDIKIGDYII